MSKKEKIKEKLIYLRFCLGIAIATFLLTIGWGLTNYTTIELWLLIISFIATIALIFMIILLARKIKNNIDQLEDL